jgi:hypothetical protein
MTCSRCSGFMLEDHLLDMKGGYGEMWARSWRCVNCGHAHDTVVERNRLTRRAPVLACSSAEPDYQNEDVHLGIEAFPRFAA